MSRIRRLKAWKVGCVIMVDDKHSFCGVEHYSIIIPYSDFLKIADMAKNYEAILASIKRTEEQYAAMRGMFSEVLEICRETREFVRDT